MPPYSDDYCNIYIVAVKGAPIYGLYDYLANLVERKPPLPGYRSLYIKRLCSFLSSLDLVRQ